MSQSASFPLVCHPINGQASMAHVAVSNVSWGNEELFIVDHEYEEMITVEDVLWGNDSNALAEVFTVGRGKLRTLTLKDGRKVVIRPYLRGGFIAKFNRQYLLMPAWFRRSNSLLCSRPFEEFVALMSLRAQGVRVPRVVAALVRRRFGVFCQGWIVSELVEDATNLLSALKSSPYQMLRQRVREAGAEAERMLLAGIVHRDLHLGNILLTPTGVTLVDFDKAEVRNQADSQRFRRYLLQRFRRSAVKHGLSELTFDFASGLGVSDAD